MIHAIIVGGGYSADYVIKSFAKNHIPFIVVNEDKEVCTRLSKSNHIEVYCSPTNKEFTYKDLNINKYDLVVALEEDDVKNYIIVTMLKKMFKVKRGMCTVNDPDNVEIFKKLGVDAPISSSLLLSKQILNESNIESVLKTYTFEDNHISITEITLKHEYKIVGKTIADSNFPQDATICCIYRSNNVIIPRGSTTFQDGDRLVICCTSEKQKKVIDFIKK